MSNQSSSSASRIEQLEVHLRTNRDAALIQRRYLWLAYLQETRPKSERRELFLHLHAPYRAYDGFPGY